MGGRWIFNEKKCTIHTSTEGSGIKNIMFYDNWGGYSPNGNQSGWQRDNYVRVTKTFFLESVASFSRFFLQLESATLWARCRAIIDRTIMCQRTRDFWMATPNASEIPTITYRLNSTFQSAAAHRPASWAGLD